MSYFSSAILYALVTAPLVQPECVNWCSQHGLCTDPGPAGFCDCEIGYTGDDCDTLVCPKNDDPLTRHQVPFLLHVQVLASEGRLEGTVELTFQRETVVLEANGMRTRPEDCAARVERLRNVERARCDVFVLDRMTGAVLYAVEMLEWPVEPWENNLYFHDGNPSIGNFSCGTAGVEGNASNPTCEVSIGNTPGDRVFEYAACSRHGQCDQQTGRCVCDRGWKGPDCNDNEDAADALVAAAQGPYFTGSLLKLESVRKATEDFRILDVVTGGKQRLRVSGTGHTEIFGGSVQIVGEDADADAYVRTTANTMELHNADLNLTHGTLRVANALGQVLVRGPADDFDESEAIMKVLARGGERLLDVGATGIHTGVNVMIDSDLSLEGSAQISSGDLLLDSGHLMLKSGVVSVKRAKLVPDSTPTFLLDSDVARTKTLAQLRQRRPLARDGAVLRVDLDEVSADDAYVLKASVEEKEVFSVDAVGRVASSGGVEVKSGGVQVRSGGFQVDGGGLQVDGGLTLRSGALNLSHAEAVQLPQLGVMASDAKLSAMSVLADNPNYSGVVLRVSANAQANNEFSLFEASSDGEVVFKVDGSGAAAVAALEVLNDAQVNGALRVHGAEFRRVSREGSGPSSLQNVSFISIESSDDSRVTLPAGKDGQFLYFHNGLSAPLVLPPSTEAVAPGAVVQLVYLDGHWRMTSAKSAAGAQLRGVVALEAAGPLDIGDHSFAAAALISTSSVPSQVCFFGKGGALRSVDSVKIMDDQTLSARLLNVEDAVVSDLRVHGGVDARGALRADALQLRKEVGRRLALFDGAKISSHPNLNYKVDGTEIELAADVLRAKRIALEGMLQTGQEDRYAVVKANGEIGAGDEVVNVREMKEDMIEMLNDKFTGVVVQSLDGVVKVDKLDISAVVSDVDISEHSLTAGSLSVGGDVDVRGDTLLRKSLSVLGSVMGSGAYIDSSDERLKMNVTNVGDTSQRLARLRPVSYHFRRDDYPERNLPPGRHFGFLAQEVEEVFPEMVSADEKGYKYLAYSEFVPLLLRETQALRKLVHDQGVRMQDLEQEMKALSEKCGE